MRTEWLGLNKRSLGIVRVSSTKQEGKVSHDTQESEIKSYCARTDLDLIEIVRIVESAAADKDRKKYELAMKKAVSLGCRHIMFYMYDRETRNLTDNERNERLVKEDKIVLHYVREMKVLYRESPDSDFFIRDVQAVTNKHFIRTLTAKVLDSMEEKAEQGWYPSNQVPLGYVVARPKDETGRELRKAPAKVIRDPNEENVRWVRREFELRAEGLTYGEIRNRCVAEGFVPKNREKSYYKATIEHRITNPFYLGQFRWRGKVYPGKHELIIPRHLVESAQGVRQRSHGSPQERLGGGIFGGGWIRCHECGSTVLYDPKSRTSPSGKPLVWHYYHCGNGKRLHKTLKGLSVHEQDLWDQFDLVVDAITLPPNLADAITRALNSRIEKLNRENSKFSKELRSHVESLQAREDQLYEDLSSRVIDSETYQRQLNRYRLERARYEQQLSTLRGRGPLFLEQNAAGLLELCKSAKTLYKSRSAPEKRKFLERLCSNPTLDKRTLRYNLRSPFGVIAEMREKDEWRTRLDDLRTALESLSPVFGGKNEP
jgi:site-specific DNA recombinase